MAASPCRASILRDGRPRGRPPQDEVRIVLRALIRHQHRQGRVRKDVARRAAKYHLAQTALGVGALDEEVAVERMRGGQYGLSGCATLKPDRHRRGLEAVTQQVLRCLGGTRSWHRGSALDMEYRYALGLAQQRYGECGGARLLGAAVPRHQNVSADLGRWRRRRDQNRAAAVEQAGLDRLVVQSDRVGLRPAHDDDVEDAAVAADEVFPFGSVIEPAVRQRCDRGLAARHSVLSHERFEQRAGAARLVEALLTERLQRNGARHVDGDEFIDAEPQREAFDVAIESTRKQKRGYEGRAHRLVRFRRDQNRLHIYPPPRCNNRLRPPARSPSPSRSTMARWY